jgi:hypothetical protein
MIHLRYLFSLLVLVFFVVSCGNNPLDVDVSSIKSEVKFVQVDSIYFSSSAKDRIKFNKSFLSSFNELYRFTYEKGLKINTKVDSTFSNQVNQFYKDPYIKELEIELKKSFSDLSNEKNQIQDALKHLKYHFPKAKQPKHIVFFNALFSYNAIATNDDVGVGLEWYLGQSNKVIKKLPAQNVYEYMKQGMERKFMVRDIVFQWVYAHIQAPTDAKFAEDMISWGKLMYCIEAAMPTAEKAIIARYSAEKYKWAEENEKQIWTYFVDQKLLFKSDEMLKLGCFNEAPQTAGLPKESPDRLGQFIGWKMVRKYMESHSDLLLDQLLKVPFAEIMQTYKID